MQAVRRITEHHQPVANLFLRLDQHQRVEMPCAHLLKGAQPIAERLLQFGEEIRFVQRSQARRVGLRPRPDQRTTVVAHRQQGHGALIGETFEGLARVGLAGRDVGDQRRLAVGPTADIDAQLFTQPRTATIGQDRQAAIDLLAIGQRQPITASLRLQRLDFRRAAPHHHIVVQRLPQAVTDPGVLHHVAEGRNAVGFGIEPCRADPAAVRHVNMLDGLGALGDPLPDAQPLIDQPRAIGQRRGAGIVAGLVFVAGLEGLDQLDPPAARPRTLLQRQSEARADQTTADDRQLAHDQATSRAPAISASISATALGTPPVRISQPVLVTTTSSSMRTPMPRHFLATSWLSAAM